MSNHGNYIVSMGNVCRWLAEQAEALGVEIFPGMAASALVSARTASVSRASSPASSGSSKDGTPGPELRAGDGAPRQVRADRRGRARQPRQAAHRPLRPRRRPRAAEVRPRHEGDLGGPPREPPPRPGHPHDGLAARHERRRRLVPLPPREQPGLRRLRRPPELREPLSLPLHGVPALQAPPAGRRGAEGRQARRLRRARDHRGRLAVGAEADLPRRRADRLLGAGFVNVPRIKGNHNAMLSGIAAAEAAHAAIAAGRQGDELDRLRRGGRGRADRRAT